MKTIEEQLEARVREVDDLNRIADLLRAENAKLRETLRATIETAQQGEAIRKAEIEALKADLEAQLVEVGEGDRIISDQGDELRELRVAIANLKAGEAIRAGELAEARALLDKVRKHPSMTVFGDIDAFLAPSSEADKGGAPMIRDSLTGQLHRAPTLADMGEVDLAPECPPGGYGLLATVNARLDALNEETDKISARITGLHAEVHAKGSAQGRAIDELAAAVGKLEKLGPPWRLTQEQFEQVIATGRLNATAYDTVLKQRAERDAKGRLDIHAAPVAEPVFEHRSGCRWIHIDGPCEPEAAEAGHAFDDGGNKWERFCWHYSDRGNRCAKWPGAPIHAKPCTRCSNNGGNGVPCPNCGRTG